MMPPESRDRLARAVAVAGMLGLFLDGPEWSSNLFEPMVARRTAGAGVALAPVGLGRGGAVGRGVFGTPRNVSGPGRNMLAGSTSRGRGRQDSVLPSWYPRTPLRDITSVHRAYARTRARLLESPATADLSIGQSSEPSTRAPLEHDVSLYTPGPAVAEKPCLLPVGKVAKISLDITNQTHVGESEFLTPQRKLLNEIDTVERAVMNELRRLQRTPGAKKAERQKRVRALMSMR